MHIAVSVHTILFCCVVALGNSATVWVVMLARQLASSSEYLHHKHLSWNNVWKYYHELWTFPPIPIIFGLGHLNKSRTLSITLGTLTAALWVMHYKYELYFTLSPMWWFVPFHVSWASKRSHVFYVKHNIATSACLIIYLCIYRCRFSNSINKVNGLHVTVQTYEWLLRKCWFLEKCFVVWITFLWLAS